MEFYESFCKVSGNLFFNATTNVCVGIWAFDSRLWCHTQEAPVSSLMPPRGCSWLTGGGAGPATRCPGRGGDLARLSVALCWSAPRSLRAPCVSRACPVCPPPSTVPALSGKEDLPSAPPPQRPALLRNSLGAPGQPGHLLRLWRGGVWGPRTAAPRTLIVGLGEHHFPAKRGRCLRTCRHRGLSPAGPRPVLPSCPPCALRSRAAFPPRYAARTPF